MKRSICKLVSLSAIALALSLDPAAAVAGAKEGQAVFETQKCIACHSLAGKKGKLAKKGGPLDGVGSKRSADWMKKYLKDPTSVVKDAQMPKYELTDKEIDDLVAYMLTLK
jgi:mono/diheme cytochrome c family protein